MEYNTAILDNGLRVIHLPSSSQVVYCGYQIAVGARHEGAGQEGLAHFVEHTTFKGTGRRSALQVINMLESVGGELNAYTNKEGTTYYAALMRQHLPRAVDLLTDIVFRSAYPDAEVEKEKEVIIEEIESYNDSPAELIYDEFENLLFKNHPLGHNILGSVANVRRFSADDARCFAHRYYQPCNAVFFAYGDVSFKKLVGMLEKHFSAFACSVEKTATPERAGGFTASVDAGEVPSGVYVFDKHTHQAHVMMGTRAYSIHHPDRIALYLLNNMLGGPGMNSRLNLSLRERRGLVYTVESAMACYADTGSWSVYFGCDHEDVDRCVSLVQKELHHLQKKPISSRQLSAAKQQLKGQIGIACDNRESFALDFGKNYLHYGWEKDVEQLYRQIDAITAEQLLRVAQELFPDNRLLTLIFQ